MSNIQERNIQFLISPNFSITSLDWFNSKIPSNILIFSQKTAPNKVLNTIPLSNIKKYLGSENINIILELEYFNLDLILSLAGTLSENGNFLIILTSKLNTFHSFLKEAAELYQIPFYLAFNYLEFNTILCQLVNLLFSKSKMPNTNSKDHQFNLPILNTEQRNFISVIINKMTNHSLFTYLLTGERGTGKTSTIFSLVNICESKLWKICLLDGGEGTLSIKYKAIANLPIITTENYEQHVNNIDILIIEEAAAIPIHKLTSILQKFPRTILVTTNIGYEGNSQGINLKLPYNITTFKLTHNYRYRIDRCELFLQRLQFKPTENKSHQLDLGEDFLTYNFSSLTSNYELLCAISDLLINSHYQETTQDMVRWLSNQHTYVSIHINKYAFVDAICVYTQEGPIEQDLAKEIFYGRRRPHDNLLPQTLMAHASINEAFKYTYFRIERIAVDLNFRRLKLATKLLEKVYQTANDLNIPYIGTSFALTKTTSCFWFSNNFKLINLSLTKDNASGQRSLLMIKAVNSTQENKCIEWENKFKDKIEHNILRHTLIEEKQILQCLLRNCFNSEPMNNTFEISAQTINYWQNNFYDDLVKLMLAIANGNHSIEHSIFELKIYYLINFTSFLEKLSNQELNCIKSYLMNYNLPKLATDYKLSGKKELFRYIRLILKKIME